MLPHSRYAYGYRYLPLGGRIIVEGGSYGKVGWRTAPTVMLRVPPPPAEEGNYRDALTRFDRVESPSPTRVRERGQWIPACAGMTAWVYTGMTEGVFLSARVLIDHDEIAAGVVEGGDDRGADVHGLGFELDTFV